MPLTLAMSTVMRGEKLAIKIRRDGATLELTKRLELEIRGDRECL